MTNGKASMVGVIAALLLLAAALLVLQPYTADWPGTEYTQPAREYLHAAMRQDSVELVRMSGSPAPVRWALASARRHPDTLALWRGRIQAYTGIRQGDTAEVFVYPPGEPCGEAPILLRVVGAGSAMRVLEASSGCLR
jgi:hypothetical protein